MRPFAVPRLGLLTVRSFLRSPLPAAALAALVLIPLLYSGMYLWSFWDPFGRMQHLPVALVNEDRPVEVDGREMDAGGELTDTLLERGDLDWRPVGAEEAARGVADGDYYVSLTIPSHFSEDLSSPSRDREAPVQAMLEAHYNDSNSFIVRQLAGSAFKEVRDAAAASAISDYLDEIFVGFNEIHGRTEEAAEGADELSGGADSAEEGAGELSTGVDDAHTGAGSLSSGLDELYTGSRSLAAGAGTASEEVSTQVEKLDGLADEWLPQLEEDIPAIQERADTAAEVTGALSTALEELPEEIDTAGLSEVDARLAAFLRENPGLETENPDLYTLLRDLQGAMDTALSVAGYVDGNRDDIGSAAEEAAALSERAAALSEDLPDMVDRAEEARDKVDELDEGLAELAEGSAALRDGLADASEGASELDSGLGLLSGGAGDLHEGLGQLASGSGELAEGLDEGAGEIPTYSDRGRSDASAVMSEPIRLDSEISNEAPNYGTGFAPFFVPLSLWVGAMVVFMVLPALSSRALASSAPSWRVALAGRVVPLLLGVGQVAVTLGALHLFLGLEARNWPLLVAFLVLTSVAFTAVVQYLNVRFGAAGRVVALALLVLQLTSAGGTYPIETSPAFFQAVGPYLPLHWGVTAMRVLLGGGDPDLVWSAFGVMGLWLVVPLLLTWLAVERKRVWTMSSLYPALKL
ncbi:YhgE/Pip domain-containing protein [Streptomonospora nanhaiensis]|uniref:YhgE/Pip domain-containing protein n=1 Tax=Streptomonospora nanhaiensis TaxID=1323731 RepID=A0ABY6YK59_9ACTN|nr:YhgE/Pip domain-containing protein [Streptomonospora nanhaiensis]WAE72598.1 YhgE/Pip domain-containing protein [Streptomonospora nanhaiensis]